jgi:hypothetical protein
MAEASKLWSGSASAWTSPTRSSTRGWRTRPSSTMAGEKSIAVAGPLCARFSTVLDGRPPTTNTARFCRSTPHCDANSAGISVIHRLYCFEVRELKNQSYRKC